MSFLRQPVLLLLAMMLNGCSMLPERDYDRWRHFHEAVGAMEPAQRRELYSSLGTRNGGESGSLTRLQLAYLMLLDTPDPIPDGVNADVSKLLAGIDDGDELAPLRDLFSLQLQLRERYARDTRQLGDVRRQCAALNTRLGGVQDERDALQRSVDTCRDQLQALKEIESMMSASDDALEVQP